MKTLIIAEAGVNHNGDINIAKELIKKAKQAGADIIKFQTFISSNCISKDAQKAEYQKKETGNNETQLDMIRKYELSFEEFKLLKEECKKNNIIFLSTAFDLVSVDYLHSINVGLWKIPSGEITNLPYLLKIASFHEPIIMSTGMCEMKEIEEAINVLKENGSGDITLLHCTTEYPAPFEDINLKAMLSLKERFNVDVGYSDHSKGIEVPIAAVALGAKVIEKHFTLDRNMEGPDHKASLEPNELKMMIDSIRNIESALGDGVKKVSNAERKNIDIARKSIVAKVNIKKGEIFTENNITTKRPGTGINPMKWFDVLGTKAIRDFEEDELIEI